MSENTPESETPPVPPKPVPSRGMSLARAWPVFIFAGIAYLIAAAAKVIVHQPEGGLYLACGVAFLMLGWIAKPKGTRSQIR